MDDRNLRDKDIRIQFAVEKILDYFGKDYFERCITDNGKELIDFWAADLCAIGLKFHNKIIYISSWDYKYESEAVMKYYVEFEIIDENSLEPKGSVKKMHGVDTDILTEEISKFLSNSCGNV